MHLLYHAFDNQPNLTSFPTRRSSDLKVNIKRSGTIAMNQQFRVDQITETHYEHPHGAFHMETYTEKVIYESLETNRKGRLAIDYKVKLNGMNERKHLLELIYKEKDERKI